MKFQIISDGSIPVPPVNGWGALERVVWSYKLELEKSGHEVLISNHKEDFLVLEDYRRFQPDIVHNHLGKHWIPFSLMHPKKKIFTNHGGAFKYSIPFWKSLVNYLRGADAFILTNIEESFFLANQINASIVPNGVFCSDISFSEKPAWSASLYLGKIMDIKRQAFFEKLGIDVLYAGTPEDRSFNYASERYLGEWTHESVKEKLTKFSNLVLLSKDELQPLVCLEAMSAGLGLVISEPATQSLDISKPWVTVIKEDMINDVEYINDQIRKNRELSQTMRQEIRSYAQTFDWSNIVKTYLSKISI